MARRDTPLNQTALESRALRAQAEQIADHFRPPIGRPSELSDPDTVQVLLAAIADGNYRETACKLAGISKVTLYNWIRKAEAGDERAIAFVNALEKAEAQAESETVRNVRAASKMPQFWAAGMTWLERKSPDRWGKRQDDASVPKVVVQIGVKDSDVQVNISQPALSPVPRSDLAEISTGQVMHEGLIIGDYVNQLDSVPACPAREPAGAPTAGGMAPIGVRGAVAVKASRRGGKGKRA